MRVIAWQPNLSLWILMLDAHPTWSQSYIDFEIAERQRVRTRDLYERLLDRTKHVKVWVSFAEFEAASLPEPEEAADGAQAANGLQNGAAVEEAPASRETHARRCVSPPSCWHIAAPLGT